MNSRMSNEMAQKVIKGLAHLQIRKGWESWDCLPSEEKAQRGLPSVYKYLEEGCKEDRARLFQWCLVTEQEAKGENETQGVLSEHQETFFFYCEGDWILTQVEQRGCGVSLLEIPQSQLDMVLHNWFSVALLEQEVSIRWPPEVPSNINHCVILWFPV